MSKLTISQKIEAALAGKSASEIEVLDLSGSTGESFEGLTDKFSNLKELHANKCGLKSTAGLPPLKNLQKLVLASNELTDLKGVAALPGLRVLDISNNAITDSKVVEQIFGAPKLECILLEGNPVKELDEKLLPALFENITMLVTVDGNNMNGPSFYENGEDYESDSTEESGSEGVGLDALQRSGELDDDEEDYIPGDGDDEELGFSDVDDEYDEDEEDEDSNHVEKSAGKKRKADDSRVSDAKQGRLSTNGAGADSGSE